MIELVSMLYESLVVLDETNVERREMVRHKTEKYLLRAEKIYNMHLSEEIKTIRQYVSNL